MGVGLHEDVQRRKRELVKGGHNIHERENIEDLDSRRVSLCQNVHLSNSNQTEPIRNLRN